MFVQYIGTLLIFDYTLKIFFSYCYSFIVSSACKFRRCKLFSSGSVFTNSRKMTSFRKRCCALG